MPSQAQQRGHLPVPHGQPEAERRPRRPPRSPTGPATGRALVALLRRARSRRRTWSASTRPRSRRPRPGRPAAGARPGRSGCRRTSGPGSRTPPTGQGDPWFTDTRTSAVSPSHGRPGSRATRDRDESATPMPPRTSASAVRSSASPPLWPAGRPAGQRRHRQHPAERHAPIAQADAYQPLWRCTPQLNSADKQQVEDHLVGQGPRHVGHVGTGQQVRQHEQPGGRPTGAARAPRP